MKALGREARTPNVVHSSRWQHCKWCDDSGYVLVQTRVTSFVDAKTKKLRQAGPFEEMGPCPYCLAGFLEEFPEPLTKEQEKSPPIKPPWGPDGFWADRGEAELVPVTTSSSQPLPQAENARRMRELNARIFGGLLKDMPGKEDDEAA